MISIIETPRLILRRIDMAKDFDAIAEMMADAETMRFIGGKPLNRAEAWRNVASIIGHNQIRGYGYMSVIEKSTNTWVGRVGPWYPEGWPEPEIGWAIHPDHCRKGYAKEAGAACINYVFNVLGWDRIIHVISEENVASIKTAEAVGSEKIYFLDHLSPFGDINCWAYGQTRKETQEKRARKLA